MAKGKKTGGRQKGSQNKVTASVKQALTDAFERVRVGTEQGGVDSLVEWANDNPTEFYKLWGRLAPTEVQADVKGGLVIRVVRE
jgi:hypothetical protein